MTERLGPTAQAILREQAFMMREIQSGDDLDRILAADALRVLADEMVPPKHASSLEGMLTVQRLRSWVRQIAAEMDPDSPWT